MHALRPAFFFSDDNSGPSGEGGSSSRGPSYDEKLEAVALVYHRRKIERAILHIVIAGVYLVAMLFLTRGLAMRLSGISERYFGGSTAALAALYTFVFFLLYRIVSFPLHYDTSYRLEHRFLLSTETFGRWLWRDVKAFLVSQAVLMVLVVVFYYFLEVAGPLWWLYAALAYVVFAVVLGKIFPVVILPLFYKRTPLKDRALAERLVKQAKQARFAISNVHVFDLSRQTKKVNAALVGMGKTRQIILSDTLLASFTRDEIEAVFAHEIGHHVHNHFLRLFIFGSALSLAGFYVAHAVLDVATVRMGFETPADIATLPLLVLIMAGFAFAVRPISNAYSRRLETESDDYAVAAMGQAAPFVGALEKLARTNLAHKRPSRFAEVFFYDHPPLAKRIARAQSQDKEIHAKNDDRAT